MRASRRLGAAAGLMLCTFAIPASASGSVTIGANLATLAAPSGTYDCAGGTGCTVRQVSLAAASTAVGGLTSPVNGTVTGFRVKTGAAGANAIAFRVLRPAGTLFTGAGSAAPIDLPANSTTLTPVSLPIRIGDSIGLNCCQGDDSVRTAGGADSIEGWGSMANELLADGETRAADFPDTGTLALNADVEPSNAFSFGKPREKGNKKVVINATVPNPGVLHAGFGVSHGSDPMKKRKWPRLFRTGSLQVDAPGKVRLVMKLRGSVRKALSREEDYSEKTSFGVAFTPSFGAELGHVAGVTVKG